MRQPDSSAPGEMDPLDVAGSFRVVDAAQTSDPPHADPPSRDSQSAPSGTPGRSVAPAPDLADQPTILTPAADLTDQPTARLAVPNILNLPDLEDVTDRPTARLATPKLTDQPALPLAVPLAAAWDAAGAPESAAPAAAPAPEVLAPEPVTPQAAVEPEAVAAPEVALFGAAPAGAAPANVTHAFDALLPMTPGMGIHGAPAFPIPMFPRFGPPSGELTQPVPAPPPVPRAARVTAPISPQDAQEFLGPSPALAPGPPRKAPITRPVTPREAPKTRPVTPSGGSISGRLSAAIPVAWRRDSRARWGVAGAVALLVAVVVAMLWPAISTQLNRALGIEDLPALTMRLEGDTQMASLSAASASFGDQTYPIAQPFVAYYAAHDGKTTLGSAITPVFTSNLGQTQFFTAGALINAGAASPDAVASAASAGPGDLDLDLARNGVDDQAHGVIALPLSQALLELGSAAPIGGSESSATYATLRDAAQPGNFRLPPAATAGEQALRRSGAPIVLLSSEEAFVIEGKRASHAAGHAVPLVFWSYMTSPGVAPQGWWVDVGLPLTEAIPVTATRDGAPRQLLVQAFTQTVLIADLGAPGPTGAPTVTPQPAGQDYLRTVGGPTVYTSNGARRWLTADGALRPAAGSATVAVGIDTNGAVRLTGESRWVGGALWYGVSWQTPTRNGNAWVQAAFLTATQPSGLPTYGFDLLSPSLETTLQSYGSNIGVVAYDLTRGATYAYNPHGIFIMGSSAKVPLLISYLESIESQGRGPNDFEVATMTAMIESSDNNAAEVIYDSLGFDAGQDAYMASWGITDYQSNPNGWGWGEWSPDDMAHLLALLQTGKVLTAGDRAFALSLMNNIESDQQFGVGDSAPAGATFWMKDGWVTGPDNDWNINSSGIVTVGSETYIVTVYIGGLDPNSGYTEGVNTVNQVCGAIGQALK